MRRVLLTVNGKRFEVTLIERRADSLTFACEDSSGETRTYTAAVSPATGAAAPAMTRSERSAPTQTSRLPGNDIIAPIPGIVVSVSVGAGSAVKAGETVAVIEAMKMENSIRSPRDGVIDEVLVAPGAEVSTGQMLIRMKSL